MDTLERVYDLLAQRNITLFRLAKLSGISPSTLRNTRCRQGQLKSGDHQRICRALDITLSEFFAGQDTDREEGRQMIKIINKYSLCLR